MTDDVEYANKVAAGAKATQDGEKKIKDAQDEDERKKAEAEAKAGGDKKDDDDDDEDEDDNTVVPGEAEAHDEL